MTILAGLPSGRGMVQINHICSACRDCTTTSLDDNYSLQLIPNVWRASKLKKVSKRPGHCLVITPTSWFPSLDKICIKINNMVTMVLCTLNNNNSGIIITCSITPMAHSPYQPFSNIGKGVPLFSPGCGHNFGHRT